METLYANYSVVPNPKAHYLGFSKAREMRLGLDWEKWPCLGLRSVVREDGAQDRFQDRMLADPRPPEIQIKVTRNSAEHQFWVVLEFALF